MQTIHQFTHLLGKTLSEVKTDEKPNETPENTVYDNLSQTGNESERM